MLYQNTEIFWAGVDLAASEKGVSAVAWGDAPDRIQVQEVRTNAALTKLLKDAHTIWIDAPLTVGEGAFRACDRALHQLGISVMPLTWPAMKKLHYRAQKLQIQLPHITWRETFPWAVYKSWGLTRKDLPRIHQKLKELGFQVEAISIHAYDALAAWWMGWLEKQGKAHALTGLDGTLWIPQSLLTPLHKP